MEHNSSYESALSTPKSQKSTEIPTLHHISPTHSNNNQETSENLEIEQARGRIKDAISNTWYSLVSSLSGKKSNPKHKTPEKEAEPENEITEPGIESLVERAEDNICKELNLDDVQEIIEEKIEKIVVEVVKDDVVVEKIEQIIVTETIIKPVETVESENKEDKENVVPTPVESKKTSVKRDDIKSSIKSKENVNMTVNEGKMSVNTAKSDFSERGAPISNLFSESTMFRNETDFINREVGEHGMPERSRGNTDHKHNFVIDTQVERITTYAVESQRDESIKASIEKSALGSVMKENILIEEVTKTPLKDITNEVPEQDEAHILALASERKNKSYPTPISHAKLVRTRDITNSQHKVQESAQKMVVEVQHIEQIPLSESTQLASSSQKTKSTEEPSEVSKEVAPEESQEEPQSIRKIVIKNPSTSKKELLGSNKKFATEMRASQRKCPAHEGECNRECSKSPIKINFEDHVKKPINIENGKDQWNYNTSLANAKIEKNPIQPVSKKRKAQEVIQAVHNNLKKLKTTSQEERIREEKATMGRHIIDLSKPVGSKRIVENLSGSQLKENNPNNSTIKLNSQTTCVYCTQSIAPKTSVKQLSCLHKAHPTCWMTHDKKKNSQCPACNSTHAVGHQLKQIVHNVPKKVERRMMF